MQDSAFDADLDAVIARAAQVGIVRFCCDSVSESDWVLLENLYKIYGANTIRPGFGIHPWYAHTVAMGWEIRLLDKLKQYPDAAVGEIGLDGVKSEEIPWETQRSVFISQLEIANNLQRPATIHCVRAWNEMISVLSSLGKVDSEMTFHGFSGTAVEMDWLLTRYNAYFSFGAARFNPQRTKIQQAIAWLRQNAPEKIRYESDAPFMPPIKGTRNEPAFTIQPVI